MLTLSTREKRSLFSFARQVIYAILLTLAIVVLWKLGRLYGHTLVDEFGIIENIQVITLALTALLFGGMAVISARFRPILPAMAALCLAAIIREYDSFFDSLLPVISWKFCWLFPMAGFVWMFIHRHELRAPLFEFLESNSLRMMVMAIIIVVPLAQCIGHRSFIEDVLGGFISDSHEVRRFAEEPFELMGYLQLFLSAVEFYIELVLPQRRR